MDCRTDHRPAGRRSQAQKVVDRILEVRPETVIYLSCNVSTQARDTSLLKTAYQLKELKLFNFFPATPHIEGLAILQKN
ncbi:MAG: hypothetical protein ACREGJ_02485 [Candidatus Saccharimonadales bacterium]